MAALAAATSSADASGRPASRPSRAALVSTTTCRLPAPQAAAARQVRAARPQLRWLARRRTFQDRQLRQARGALLLLLLCGAHQQRQPRVRARLARGAQRRLHLLRPVSHVLAQRKLPVRGKGG